MTSNDQALTRLWDTLRMVGWTAVPVILLIPPVAMRFTGEVNWNTLDFAFAATVLIGAGLVLELVAWLTREPAVRFGAALAVGAVVGLIWSWAVG